MQRNSNLIVIYFFYSLVTIFTPINDRLILFVFSLSFNLGTMALFRRFLPMIYGILMIFVITCIFTRAFTDLRRNLLDPLSAFDYPRTYVELYFLVLFDVFLFLIRPLMVPMKFTRLILILVQLVVYAYSLSKFLIFYEWSNVRQATSPYQFDRFDYLALIFIPGFSIRGIFVWTYSFSTTSEESTRSDEVEPLLVATEDEENLNVQIKQSSGSWWRIVKLGRPEWKLYLIGSVFLLTAASST